MPLDYYVWTIRGPGVSIRARHRIRRGDRRRARTPAGAVRRGGSRRRGRRSGQVTDVIISHMHYDHAGNHELFSAGPLPSADRGDGFLHRQRECAHAIMRAPYAAPDVQAMVGKLVRRADYVSRWNCRTRPGHHSASRRRPYARPAGRSCTHSARLVVLASGRGALLRQLARAAALSPSSTMSRPTSMPLRPSRRWQVPLNMSSPARSLGALALSAGARRSRQRSAGGSRTAQLIQPAASQNYFMGGGSSKKAGAGRHFPERAKQDVFARSGKCLPAPAFVWENAYCSQIVRARLNASKLTQDLSWVKRLPLSV